MVILHGLAEGIWAAPDNYIERTVAVLFINPTCLPYLSQLSHLSHLQFSTEIVASLINLPIRKRPQRILRPWCFHLSIYNSFEMGSFREGHPMHYKVPARPEYFDETSNCGHRY